jgi:hypothetical protein
MLEERIGNMYLPEEATPKMVALHNAVQTGLQNVQGEIDTYLNENPKYRQDYKNYELMKKDNYVGQVFLPSELNALINRRESMRISATKMLESLMTREPKNGETPFDPTAFMKRVLYTCSEFDED